jgi:plasmid stabilization system protein ParE
VPPPSVRLHPDAIAEAKAAYAWYAERNPSAANAFISELDHAISQIQTDPERWTMHLHGTRKFLLRRFPYEVVYRIAESAIQVIAVPHGRRRPGYWRARRF